MLGMQGIFESMETKESAFEAAGTDGDAQKIEDVLWSKSNGIVDGDILEFFREHRHRGLTDRAAGAIPMNIVNVIIFDIEADLEFVSASRVGFGMGDEYSIPPLFISPFRGECLFGEGRFVPWVTVVVENVFRVQIHSTSL